MDRLRELITATDRLLPLEEGDVERFEELVDQIFEIGTQPAAEALFSLLDDGCKLGGVMQSVADLLQVFPSGPLVGALATTIVSVSSKASFCLEHVLRGLIFSETTRAELKRLLAQLGEPARAVLCRHVANIAKSATYARAAQDLLGS